MPAPLYRDLKAPRGPGNGHKGLWYERFFDRYSPEWTLDEAAKRTWIESVVGKAGEATQLTAAVERLARLCGKLNGRTRVYAAAWHFATGLGNPHPVENGFAWHPTLGVPYMPGSMVKGLLRAWAESWMPFADQPTRLATLYRWFGSEDKSHQRRSALRAEGAFEPPARERDLDTEAGAFIFFDALPVRPVPLKLDVMTPHMGKWYELGGEISDVDRQPERVPADWHDPVPVYFLVADRPEFQLAVAPRTADGDKDLDAIMDALGDALEWLGAGAKTAAGYGAVSRDHDKEQALREQFEQLEQERLAIRDAAIAALAEERRIASLDPFEQSIEAFLKDRPDKNQSEISAVIAAAKQGRWQGEDLARVAAWLKKKMIAERSWKETSGAKRPDRDKAHQNTLLVMRWLGQRE